MDNKVISDEYVQRQFIHRIKMTNEEILSESYHLIDLILEVLKAFKPNLSQPLPFEERGNYEMGFLSLMHSLRHWQAIKSWRQQPKENHGQ